MVSFEFYVPKIIFGVGEVERVGEEAKKLGDKALLVTGKTMMRKLGVLDRVMRSLEAAGVQGVHFDQVEPNPRLTTVEAGAELARREGCQFTIGLGGGSAMDAAKAIAIAAVIDGNVWDHIYQGALTKFPEKALPVMEVPTTAATGSESDAFAVITKWDAHEKMPIFGLCILPQVSIVDPQLTVTVPPRMTAEGAVDIVSHAIDTDISGTSPAPLQDRFVDALVATVMENAKRAMEDGEDLEARSNLSWCSTVAISDIPHKGRAGSFPLHWLEHVVSGWFDISHGAGLAALFPSWMEFTYPARVERFALMAERAFGVDTRGMSREQAARMAIEKMREWLQSIGLDVRLRDLGVEEGAIEQMARDCIRCYGFGEDCLADNPRRIYLQDAIDIYRSAF